MQNRRDSPSNARSDPLYTRLHTEVVNEDPSGSSRLRGSDVFLRHRRACALPRNADFLWNETETFAFNEISIRMGSERCQLYRMLQEGHRIYEATLDAKRERDKTDQ